MNSSSKFSSFLFINYLLLFGAGLIWGSQYILNKIALESFSTSIIAAGRIGIGALVLTLLTLFLENPKSSGQQKFSFWKSLPDFILIGLLEATLPCILVAWAQLRLASSVTAILIGTVPLFTTLLEFFFVSKSTLSWKKISGIFLGFFGIVVLMAPELMHSTRSSNQGSLFLPVMAALLSALFFAMAMLLIQTRLGTRFGPIRTAQGILTGAAITTIPLMLWLTKPWMMTSFHPTSSAIIALITLGIFCGGLVYTLFVILINRAGASFASTCNYLVPPIGAFLGIVFSKESFTWNLLASLILVLLALWISSEQKKSHH